MWYVVLGFYVKVEDYLSYYIVSMSHLVQEISQSKYAEIPTKIHRLLYDMSFTADN